MRKRRSSDQVDLVYGALDVLILRTLFWGPLTATESRSPSSAFRKMRLRSNTALYPASQRLLQEGWIKATWGISGNNQRAKFYRLTPAVNAS